VMNMLGVLSCRQLLIFIAVPWRAEVWLRLHVARRLSFVGQPEITLR
jgi:hypothetical protein